MVSTVELQIPVPWGYVSGKTFGDENGRKVLALHGGMDNCGTYDLLLPLLSPKLYFVCIDLPGHGQSSHFPTGTAYGHLEAVVVIRRVVKYLQWENFDYIGHSFGAGVGSMYAAIFPETVRKMVMLDYAKMLSWDKEQEITEFETYCKEFLAIDRQKAEPLPVFPFTQAKLCDLYVLGTKGDLNKDQAKILLKRGVRQLEPNADKWTLSRDAAIRNCGLMRLSHEATFKILQSIQCHLLIIKAGGSKWDQPDEVVEKALAIYKANCKSYEFVEVPGNHFIPLSNPTVLAPHINRFLEF